MHISLLKEYTAYKIATEQHCFCCTLHMLFLFCRKFVLFYTGGVVCGEHFNSHAYVHICLYIINKNEAILMC